MSDSELLTRRLAVEIFDAVLRRGKGLEDEYAARIERRTQKEPMEVRDKTFVRLLATVMLRRLGQIDDIVARFLTKPLPEKASFVTDVLRVGAAQIVFLDTPAHAAVSTGVSLVKSSRDFGGFAALTNAVLRRVAREGKEIAAKQDAAKLNVPAWLYSRWRKEYGEDAARKIAEAGLNEAPLDFTVKGDPQDWAEPLQAFVMPTGTLRREKNASVPALPGFEEGAWWVQDFSAALPARLFSGLNGKTAVDICAAPGGKTAQLIAAGADATAIDVSANRLARLRENLGRLRFKAETICADARKWHASADGKNRKFDAVLLDAPCSATGTLRRHPDVARHRTPADVERLNQAQRELLRVAVDMAKDDAVIVYCVCSVLPEEGRLMIDEAVESGLVERVPLTERDVPVELISSDGDLRVLPFYYADKGGCDGFFAARLRKRLK